MNMKDCYLRGMMGLVVGDALGVPVEFLTRQQLANRPVDRMLEGGFHEQPAGTWSDDSSMGLATLASLRNGYDLADIAEQFSRWQKEGEYTPWGEVFDMGNTCFRAIANFQKTGNPYSSGMKEEYDNGNGSLMRILPMCIYVLQKQMDEKITNEEAISMIHDVSAITHAHIRSRMACGFYYFCVKSIVEREGSLIDRLQNGINDGFCFYQKDSESLLELKHFDRLKTLADFKNVAEDEIRSGGYVIDTIEAAMWCLVNSTSYKECVLKAVNLGDDTDTTGAVAGGLAGLFYGYHNIPKEWREIIVRRDWIEEMCDSMVYCK